MAGLMLIIHSLSIDDFVVDESREVVGRCPAGHEPQSSVHDVSTGKTRTVMPATGCGACEHVDECPIQKGREGFYLEHTAKTAAWALEVSIFPT